jgi:hypothetical protein
MSDPNAKLVVSKEMRNQMAKPRMTKAEKLFTSRITALISKHPEIRNGVSFIDRTALDYLKPEIKEQYLTLLIKKTR